jgi:hypothetical protein
MANTRGAGLVEYVILTGAIAILAFAGFSQLGKTVYCKMEAEGDAIFGVESPGAGRSKAVPAWCIPSPTPIAANGVSRGLARPVDSPAYAQNSPVGAADSRGSEENRGPRTLPNVPGNCLSYALGLDEAVPNWRQTLDPNWPHQYMPSIRCSQIDCNDRPDCTSRNKIVIFVDPAQHDNFHAMRQQCNGLWVSKNGDDPPVADLPGPPLDYYKSIYPPKGEVQTTCWSCPNPLF